MKSILGLCVVLLSGPAFAGATGIPVAEVTRYNLNQFSIDSRQRDWQGTKTGTATLDLVKGTIRLGLNPEVELPLKKAKRQPLRNSCNVYIYTAGVDRRNDGGPGDPVDGERDAREQARQQREEAHGSLPESGDAWDQRTYAGRAHIPTPRPR